MIQEVITYLIIGSAVTVAIMKIAKRFRKKKSEKVDYKKAKISADHNCGECAAECMLRDAPKRIIEASNTQCTTEISASK